MKPKGMQLVSEIPKGWELAVALRSITPSAAKAAVLTDALLVENLRTSESFASRRSLTESVDPLRVLFCTTAGSAFPKVAARVQG